MLVVYFSGVSGYTHKFVNKLETNTKRIPIFFDKDPLYVDEPFILIVPTYAGGKDNQGAVPKQVIKFLNIASNRQHIKAVIGTGNANFGADYCKAGRIISAKTQTPLIAYVELSGTPYEVDKVKDRIKNLGEVIDKD